MKIQATEITLLRAEGLISECYEIAAVAPDVWQKANSILNQWRQTAPAAGEGYDKCDYRVKFADGKEKPGRYDLVKGEYTLLEAHLKNEAMFHSGRYNPAHMSETRYRTYINYFGEEVIAAYGDLLDNYQLGD